MALDNILQWFSAGFGRCQAGTVDSSGYFTGDDGTPASATGTGMLQLWGATASVPSPQPRIVTPEANNGKVGSIQLAPIETVSFQLGLKVMNQTFAALVQGTKVHALEEWSFVDFDPLDPTYATMCFAFSRPASSKVSGSPGNGWEHLLLPSCQVNFDGVGQLQTGANEATYNFTVTVNRAQKYPWGLAYSLTDNGTTESSGKVFWTENPWTMHAFTGDNSDTTVVVDYTPVSTTLNTKNLVYVNGTKETSGVTISSKTYTWGAAPGTSAKVVIAYEHNYT